MSTFKFDGVTVKFPFPPYDIQKEYMRKVIMAIKNNENAMLESPTGTGKTLSLLCASLAAIDFRIHDYVPWQYEAYEEYADRNKKKARKGRGKKDLFMSSFERMVNAALPDIPIQHVAGRKLIYCSRTHSQLRQVVREIRKTAYRPKVMVMGSREQLCCNPEVRSQPQYAQKHICRQLGNNCVYRQKLSVEKINDIYYGNVLPDRGLMDIEDLYKYSKSKGVMCPYYVTRDIITMIESEVLLMPYNYIMDHKIRELLPFDENRCVLIIDEAHNIDSFCLDSMSIDLSAKILYEIQQEIKGLINKGVAKTEAVLKADNDKEREEFAAMTESQYYLALSLIQKIEDNIRVHLNNVKNVNYPGVFMYDFLKECGIDSSTIDQVTFLFQEILQSRAEYFPNSSTCYSEIIVDLLKLLFNEKNQFPPSRINKWIVMLYYQEDYVYKKETHRYEQVEYPCLGFWCMDCSVAMQALLKTGISTVIFTSGTLSPMNPLIYEFQIPISHQLENLHVITNSQCIVATIDKSIHNYPLSSSYSSRQNPVMKEEMMDTILSLVPSIPGNVIIFFPSYGYLNDCYVGWEKDGRLQLLQSIKEVYREESGMSNEQFAVIVNHLDRAQYERGAILLAVCRGKASEGIDFSDDKCRCVIVTGVPYPPFADLKVKMRRMYLDEKNRQQQLFNERSRQAIQRKDAHIPTHYDDLPLASSFNIQAESFTGNDWYTISAHRAVNQSVGRAIRHKDDFGIILLMDERFTSPVSQAKLSKWMHPFIRSFESLNTLESDMEFFFKQQYTGYKPPPKPALRQLEHDVNTFEKRLGIGHDSSKSSGIQAKQKVDSNTKSNVKIQSTGGLLKKLQTTKSQSLSLSQPLQTPKKSVTSHSIDSDDEIIHNQSKREAFMNHLKTVQSESKPSQQVTPPPKGIKRFFHSEEVKRPKTTANGTLHFEKPKGSRNLFG